MDAVKLNLTFKAILQLSLRTAHRVMHESVEVCIHACTAPFLRVILNRMCCA